MARELILPVLTTNLKEARIAKWIKAEGEAFKAGDTLAEVETDKALMDMEAEEDGVLGKIIVSNGQYAQVGQAIAILLQEGEALNDIEAALNNGEVDIVATKIKIEAEPANNVNNAANAPMEVKSRIIASPIARRLAAQAGVDLAGLSGSGPKGRIVKIDVERAKVQGLPKDPMADLTGNNAQLDKVSKPQESELRDLTGIGSYRAISHSPMRHIIADRLTMSKTTIPHFYLHAQICVDELLELRESINLKQEADERISLNDFVIKAVAKAFHKMPETNVIWTQDALLQLQDVDIAFAVATDGGLITPIIRKADDLSLGAIAVKSKELAQKARHGQLKPEDYQGGGVSISNLGMFGVEAFEAIINPPQSCIFAIGSVVKKPIERDDEIVLAKIMSCSLSVDHRAIDGALTAKLLATFKQLLENPMKLLV